MECRSCITRKVDSYSIPSIVTAVKTNGDWTGDWSGVGETRNVRRGYGGKALKRNTLSDVCAFIRLTDKKIISEVNSSLTHTGKLY